MIDHHPVQRLLAIMARLRDPSGGCPWDLRQTFATIAPYTLEEAYEVVDAIDRRAWNELRDELGDLLLQVVYHAQMASEAGHFAFDDVVEAIIDKMVRRHPHVFRAPHVFGEAATLTSAEHSEDWERQKADERGPSGPLDGVPVALPTLVRALKLQQRAARVGFDWENMSDVLAKLDEEIAELRSAVDAREAPERVQDEIGDILFTVVNLARALAVDADAALRHTNNKFSTRFNHMAASVENSGQHLSDLRLTEMEELWRQAKAALTPPADPKRR